MSDIPFLDLATGRAFTPDGLAGVAEHGTSRASGLLLGVLDSLAVSVSPGLQRGIPFAAYVQSLALARFEPSGWTPGGVGYAHSIVDYVCRWLALGFRGRGR